MNFVISYVQYIGKNKSDQLLISASFQIMNIGYRKTEKFDIDTPLIVIQIYMLPYDH